MPEPKPSFALRANIALLRFSRNWSKFILVLLGLYASLPFVAPTLMHFGAESAGRALYTLYSPFCHQFAFRSIYLYGEQPFYPRYNVANSPYTPFEEAIAGLPDFDAQRTLPFWGRVGDIRGFTPGFQGAAREFVGNETMGYKTALCARDVAIYWGLFIGLALYSIPVVRQKLRPLPILLYFIIGLGPIGLDGFSQLLSYPPFEFWPVRETSPFFRISTGAMFGLMTAWMAFPQVHLAMLDTRYQLEHKLRQRGIRA